MSIEYFPIFTLLSKIIKLFGSSSIVDYSTNYKYKCNIVEVVSFASEFINNIC